MDCSITPLCEVEVVTPRGCWGLTSWTCPRRACPATTGGRAEDVRQKRRKAASNERERQRRNEGGEATSWRRAPGSATRPLAGDPRLSTALGALPGRAGRRGEVRCGERRVWRVGEDVSSMARRWRECHSSMTSLTSLSTSHIAPTGRPWRPFVDVDYTRKPTSHRRQPRKSSLSGYGVFGDPSVDSCGGRNSR